MGKIRKIFTTLCAAALLFTMLVPVLPEANAASGDKVYYTVDFSEQVLRSRISQKVSGDCAVVSMATIESYLHGATTDAGKSVVYDALITANTDNDYAYWGNCGYVWYEKINWETVYHQLTTGYPVIVHRPAAGNNSQHWSVVAGYVGSATTLETDKFKIVEVYDGKTDIFTSEQWGTGTTIDRMVTRKNGIAIPGLSGIRLAINHPAPVHTYGIGHGVLGSVSADANLTSVQIMVTSLTAGSNVYNKTVYPNARSYSLYSQDADITFGKYPAGEYFYTVIAKTETNTAYRQYYFTIGSSWPEEMPARKITFHYETGSGDKIESQTLAHGSTLTICDAIPQRSGYTFKGWNVCRGGDNTWYSNLGWCTQEKLQQNGGERKLYTAGENYAINYAWMVGNFLNQEFTFHAVWEKTPGHQLSGWQQDAGKWYYYENGILVQNDWRKDSTGWCYLGADGAMLTNTWVQDSKGWCYVESSGYCATNCWKKDSVGWVWLDSEGSMVKNRWVLDGGKWYFLDPEGYMVSNQWRKDSIGWCWLGVDGVMVTNTWVKDSKGWCYIGADGYCWTNCWAKDSVGWVYLDKEGSMVYNKWIQDGGSWYYIGADGYMLSNTTWNSYKFNDSGVCTNP